MLDVIAGPDHADPLSTPRSEDSYVAAMRGDIRGLRVAWSPDMGLGQHVEPEVARVCLEALSAFAELGAEVSEASPRWAGTSVAMWQGVWVPGFASEYDLLDWKRLRGEVDDGLIGIMEEAETLSGVDVGRADVVRGAMWDAWTSFMEDYDVIVSPTLASATFPLTQFAPDWLEGASLRERILDWLLTYPYNMLNNPAITVPAGFTADGRPVGLQIAARHRAEGLLLRVASNFEAARPWADRRPVG
jgi:aspartyl-tRNA(Asn)/glutamyl-tRNA(Gln) amidotransferase subunit A